jgi:hypothetical protein
MNTRDIISGMDANARAIEEFKKTLPVYSLGEKELTVLQYYSMECRQRDPYSSHDYSEDYGRWNGFRAEVLRIDREKETISFLIRPAGTDSWDAGDITLSYDQLDAPDVAEQWLADKKAEDEAKRVSWAKEREERDKQEYERLKVKFEGEAWSSDGVLHDT